MENIRRAEVKVNCEDLLKLQNMFDGFLKDKVNMRYANCDQIMRSLVGGFYKGFLDHSSGDIKDELNISGIVDSMDFRLLKYYFKFLADFASTPYMLDLVSGKEASEACFYSALAAGKNSRQIWHNHEDVKYKYVPFTYFKKLISGDVKGVSEGKVMLPVKTILTEDQIKYFAEIGNKYYVAKGPQSDDNCDDLSSSMSKKEFRGRGSGKSSKVLSPSYKSYMNFNKIVKYFYLGFYGMATDDIIDYCSKHNVKAASVISVCDAKLSSFYYGGLDALDSLFSNDRSLSFDEYRYYAFCIGENMKNYFTKHYGKTPLTYLVDINSNQLSFDEYIKAKEEEYIKKHKDCVDREEELKDTYMGFKWDEHDGNSGFDDEQDDDERDDGKGPRIR